MQGTSAIPAIELENINYLRILNILKKSYAAKGARTQTKTEHTELVDLYKSTIHDRIWLSRHIPSNKKAEYIIECGYLMGFILAKCYEYTSCNFTFKELVGLTGITRYKLRMMLQVLSDIGVLMNAKGGMVLMPIKLENEFDFFQHHIQLLEQRTF